MGAITSRCQRSSQLPVEAAVSAQPPPGPPGSAAEIVLHPATRLSSGFSCTRRISGLT
jgi:hypothetical protein